MVAAVLDLNEGAHAAFESVGEMRGRFAHRHDVIDLDFFLGRNGEGGARHGTAPLAPSFAQSFAPCLAECLAPDLAPTPGAELLFVAEDEGDLGHVCEGGGLDLRGAAGDHDARIGALALEPAHGLTRLPHRFGVHCAGIDDDCVGYARRLRLAADDFGFASVEPATESDD